MCVCVCVYYDKLISISACIYPCLPVPLSVALFPFVR